MDEYTDYFMQLMIDLEEQIEEEITELVEEREVYDYERELEENDNLKINFYEKKINKIKKSNKLIISKNMNNVVIK